MAGQAISLVAATWLLVLRVLALYSGNKLVAIALYMVFIVTHVITIALSAVIIYQLWGSLVYVEYIGICAAYPPRTLGIVYFAPVLCEFVLVAMQLFHAYQHTRRLKTLLRPATPLLRTLYADGFAYFVVVVTLRLWTAFIFISADVSYWYLSTYLEFALISTSVSRLVLHLRGTAEIHRQTNLQNSTSIPLSQLAQTLNPHPHCKPNRRNQNHNRNGRGETARRNHASSSFQNASETIYACPSEIPQVHFSSSERLRRTESIASIVGWQGSSGGGARGRRSLLTIPDGGRRYEHEIHRCDLCSGDYDVGASFSRRADDDHSYTELFPGSPVEKGMGVPPPPGMGAYDNEPIDSRSRLSTTEDLHRSSHGIG